MARILLGVHIDTMVYIVVMAPITRLDSVLVLNGFSLLLQVVKDPNGGNLKLCWGINLLEGLHSQLRRGRVCKKGNHYNFARATKTSM